MITLVISDKSSLGIPLPPLPVGAFGGRPLVLIRLTGPSPVCCPTSLALYSAVNNRTVS